MAKVALKGNPVTTSGNLPAKGTKAPEFKLIKSDITPLSLSELKGKKIILNIFPSLETSTCSSALHRFNQIAAGKENTVVLCISKDLPFAHSRFCTAEGLTNIITLSGYRDSEFGKAYGVDVLNGLFAGLYARSVIIIDKEGKIAYTQQVIEMSHEPDYDSVLKAYSGI